MPLPAASLRGSIPLHFAGWVAQLVEQRIENPRVAGSIPAPATTSNRFCGKEMMAPRVLVDTKVDTNLREPNEFLPNPFLPHRYLLCGSERVFYAGVDRPAHEASLPTH